MTTLPVEIDIYTDYVMFCGQRIERPSSLSNVQWIKFWERVQHACVRL